MANDFFKNVKKQELENKENKKIIEQKIETPKVEIPKSEPVVVNAPVEKVKVPSTNLDIAGIIPQKGRPKESNSKKHQLCLQMREDFYEIARKRAAKDFNNSVNKYIHYLIAKDAGML